VFSCLLIFSQFVFGVDIKVLQSVAKDIWRTMPPAPAIVGFHVAQNQALEYVNLLNRYSSLGSKIVKKDLYEWYADGGISGGFFLHNGYRSFVAAPNEVVLKANYENTLRYFERGFKKAFPTVVVPPLLPGPPAEDPSSFTAEQQAFFKKFDNHEITDDDCKSVITNLLETVDQTAVDFKVKFIQMMMKILGSLEFKRQSSPEFWADLNLHYAGVLHDEAVEEQAVIRICEDVLANESVSSGLRAQAMRGRLSCTKEPEAKKAILEKYWRFIESQKESNPDFWAEQSRSLVNFLGQSCEEREKACVIILNIMRNEGVSTEKRLSANGFLMFAVESLADGELRNSICEESIKFADSLVADQETKNEAQIVYRDIEKIKDVPDKFKSRAKQALAALARAEAE